MALIKFYRGAKASYNTETHKDCVYFATDTQEIIMNDVTYGKGVSEGKEVLGVEYTAPDTITVSYADGTSDVVTLQTAAAGDSAATSTGGIISAEDIYRLQSVISEGGEPNVIEKIQLDGTDLTITNKTVNIDLSDLEAKVDANTEAIAEQKVTSGDESITVNGSAVSVNVADGGGIIVSDSGLAVDESIIPVYTGEGPIAVADNKISLTIDSSDEVLTESTSGLKATLGLEYSSSAKTITLTGVNGAVLGTVDASGFIKDGMISSVELVHENASGEEGEFIKITWNTDEGGDIIYLDVTELVDIYTGGDGITVDGYEVSVKVSSDSESYLTVDGTGVKVTGVTNAITEAAAAAKTDVAIDASAAHLTLATTVNSDGHTTYTLGDKDVASESALEEAQSDITALKAKCDELESYLTWYEA